MDPIDGEMDIVVFEKNRHGKGSRAVAIGEVKCTNQFELAFEKATSQLNRLRSVLENRTNRGKEPNVTFFSTDRKKTYGLPRSFRASKSIILFPRLGEKKPILIIL